MREKLSELICDSIHRMRLDYPEAADYLIDNGVVVREKGEWELRHVGHGHYWECSVCHTNPCIYVTKDTNFCPNCGADMRKGENG